jgi:hypothetical protein
MKALFTIVFAVQLCAAHSQIREVKIPASIKEVTVFLKGAQVTRTTVADLPAGTTNFVLTNVSPKINEASIQAQSSDNARIVAVSFRVNHMDEVKKPEQTRKLNEERTRLNSLIVVEKSTLDIYQKEESILEANKSIGGDQSGVRIQDLRETVSYFRERMKEIRQLQHASKTKLNELNEDLAKVEAQYAEVNGSKDQPQGEIVVKMSSKVPARATLTVSYLVHEASWSPLYDIRARDILSPISITYKASVRQQSGEDWKDVNLTISSGNPSLGGMRPTVRPWYLGFNNYLENSSEPFVLRGVASGVAINGYGMITGRVVDESGSPLPGVNVLVKGTTIGTVSDAGGFYSVLSPGLGGTLVFSFIGLQTQELPVSGRSNIDVTLNYDVQQLSEVVVTAFGGQPESEFNSSSWTQKQKRIIAATPVVRQTNIEFHVREPYTIPSTGETETVEMVEYEADTQFQYYCAPKLDRDAFLIAKLTGWDEYNFLEGEASLFFEGKFLGKTALDPRSTSDTLTLSLGRDRNVVVTREKVKDVSSSQMIGSNVRNTFAYEITVRNKKEGPIHIRIEDHVPVPNTKEITVDELEDSNAEVDDNTGMRTWNLTIPPGKSEKLLLKYQVKYPKHSSIILE